MEIIRTKKIAHEYKRYELTAEEQEKVTGGAPPSGQGIVDFFAWIACGFNHHYVPTGKTKKERDLVFIVDFYQIKCTDCGHLSWKRGTLPNVQGPKIDPNFKPPVP